MPPMPTEPNSTTPSEPQSSIAAALPADMPRMPQATQISEQFPDGPNVAPSAHELDAARGHVPVGTPAAGAMPGDHEGSPSENSKGR